jgi:hypothetical protein
LGVGEGSEASRRLIAIFISDPFVVCVARPNQMSGEHTVIAAAGGVAEIKKAKEDDFNDDEVIELDRPAFVLVMICLCILMILPW